MGRRSESPNSAEAEVYGSIQYALNSATLTPTTNELMESRIGHWTAVQTNKFKIDLHGWEGTSNYY